MRMKYSLEQTYFDIFYYIFQLHFRRVCTSRKSSCGQPDSNWTTGVFTSKTFTKINGDVIFFNLQMNPGPQQANHQQAMLSPRFGHQTFRQVDVSHECNNLSLYSLLLSKRYTKRRTRLTNGTLNCSDCRLGTKDLSSEFCSIFNFSSH